MKKAKKKKITLADLGPVAEYSFRNIETPEADVSFNYEGINFGPLISGELCDLPKKVADHLNSLSRPRYEFRPDPVTGHNKSIKTGEVVRFACIPTGKVNLTSKNSDVPPEQVLKNEQQAASA